MFTVDTATKYRQVVCIVIALVSLVLTISLYNGNSDSLGPALVSYAALALIIYWGNRRLYFVPYHSRKGIQDDT